MKVALSSLFCFFTLIMLSACAPKEPAQEDTASADSFPLVPEENRAPSFEAVARDLDLGGDSFAFRDLGDTFETLGTTINKMVGSFGAQDPNNMQMAMASMLPYEQIMEVLGISDLSAIGSSSYQDGSMFRNKSVIYLPNGPQGIFALMGKQPHSFDTLAMAPAGTDVFITQDVQGSVIAEVIRSGTKAISPANGEQMAAGILGRPLEPGVSMTVGEALEKADTVLTAVVRFGEMKNSFVPMFEQNVPLPQTQYLLHLKGMGWLVTDGVIPVEMDVSEGRITRTEEDGLVIYEEKNQAVDGLPVSAPTLVLDSATGDLMVTNDKSFLRECRSGEGKLAASPAYQAAVKDLPAEGNGMTYVSQKGFETFIEMRDSIFSQFPQVGGAFAIYGMYIPLLGLEQVDADAACVTVVRSDSIFNDSRWPTNSSGLSSNTSGLAITGMMAAMAIPAFNKVRAESRQKTITNNLRQIASAGQRYILENDVSEVGYDKLAGEYFAPIMPVAGESYEDLVVTADGNTLQVITETGQVVEYSYMSPEVRSSQAAPLPQATPEASSSVTHIREMSRGKTIQNNLRQIAMAGQRYILESGESEVDYDKLAGQYFAPIMPVAGESYEDLVVSENGGTLEVTTASGQTVSYEY